MQPSSTSVIQPLETVLTHIWARVLAVFGLLYVFLIGVNGLGSGFKSLGGNLLDAFFSATTDPFLGLMVGVLATTLVQSSSVTTALIVAMVAAPENPLPLANAVPMVMGANIGTTVTNTIVSLAHMGRPDEFRRAFAVATCHDFFNFMAVVILLPLEIATGFLQRLAGSLTATISGVGGVHYDSPIKGAIKAGVAPLEKLSSFVSGSSQVQAVLLIVLCGILIYVALFLLVKTMRAMLKSKVEGAVTGVLDRNALLAMIIGVIVTAMVQSSSITTSLLVPLAGAGIVTLTQAFPVTIGANIGTTVTALLASLAVTGENAAAGVTIALVHLFFNLSATAIIYPAERIRNLPLAAARKLADVAVANRWAALAYVVFLFYLLPMVLAVLDR
jgi:sodium-dependent phosphate cotransporter